MSVLLTSMVEPLAGEPGVFLVQSRSRLQVRHRVDLLEFDRNGGCSCEHFEVHIRGFLDRSRNGDLHKLPTSMRCWHIQVARESLLNQVLRELTRDVEALVGDGKRKFRVELRSWNGCGRCECKPWTSLCLPRIEAGGPAIDRNRCQHIIAARLAYLDGEVLPALERRVGRRLGAPGRN